MAADAAGRDGMMTGNEVGMDCMEAGWDGHKEVFG